MKPAARLHDPNPNPIGPVRRLQRLPSAARWTAVGILVLLVGFAAWLGIGAYQAKSNLEQARASAAHARDALLAGKSDEAIRAAETFRFRALQAHAATRSVPWRIAAAVPLVGSPLKTSQEITEVVMRLAEDVLLPATRMAGSISPDRLIDGTRLDLSLLKREEPRLRDLAAASSILETQAREITRPAYVGQLADARQQLQNQVSDLAQLMRSAAIAAKLAPSMLGADGPRSYLLAFQNNAEARGTGGLLGGFGVLRFDNGQPTVENLAKNYELWEPLYDLDLGTDFDSVYGWMRPTRDLRNSNISAHFPYPARIWSAMWEKRSGSNVNGVIAIDPVALSYLLGATGPVTMPDGTLITHENVVDLTESDIYSKFADDNEARKTYLVEIASAVAKKMTGPLPSPRKVLEALGRAALERRIAVWSSSQAEQNLLEETPLAHTIPDDPAPYAQVVINNLAGNKMDYYLKRDIEYVADSCDGDRRNSTISIRLTNTAGNGPLPEYVAGSGGLNSRLPIKVASGTMVSSVRVIATQGARLMSVTSNGERTGAITHTERGHPSFEVQIAIPRGQTAELVFRLTEPTSPGEPRVPVQPLIDEVRPRVSVPACK